MSAHLLVLQFSVCLVRAWMPREQEAQAVIPHLVMETGEPGNPLDETEEGSLQ